jgi:molybdopterin-binding protein
MLVVKSSSVGIGKNLSGEMSFSNRLRARVESLDMGELLCVASLRVSPDILIESLLTVRSAQRMGLAVGDAVEAIFKASEVSIGEIL